MSSFGLLMEPLQGFMNSLAHERFHALPHRWQLLNVGEAELARAGLEGANPRMGEEGMHKESDFEEGSIRASVNVSASGGRTP